MKTYTLLHVGAPRTGTTSIWEFFRQHEDVAVSKVKEPIWIWDKNIETYLDWFDIKGGTKVLLDCTPTSLLLLKNRKYFEEINNITSIERRCCLYTLRQDPIERVISQLDRLLADYYVRNQHSILIKNGEISFERMKFIVDNYIDDERIIRLSEGFFGTSNVFVVKVEKFNSRLSDIYNFLNISKDLSIEFDHYKNRVAFENSLGYVKYLKGVNVVQEYVASREDELRRKYGLE